MGSITSGVGLASGIDIQDIVGQLMQLERRPIDRVEQRVGELQAQRDALMDINTSVLGIREASNGLAQPRVFDTKTASSSNENVLTADASHRAAEGTYTFHVDRLASAHQMLAGGFAEPDATLNAGTLSFAPQAAGASYDANLADLNGGAGIQRGLINITDRSGVSSTIDLSRAVTLDDVLDAINADPDLNIRAGLDGDSITLSDTSDATSGSITVADRSGRSTAADLGIAGNSDGGDTLTGSAINRLSEDASLASLNDRNGVDTLRSGDPEMRISLGGNTFDISLKDARSIGDVLERINNHDDNPGVTASIGDDGVSLTLEGGGQITVDALNGSTAAADLGLLGEANNTLQGDRVIAGLNSRLLSNINGGNGVATHGSIELTNRAGETTAVDLTDARSVSDVINTINNADAGVTASLNKAGNGLLLTDTSGGTGNLVVQDVDDATIAADLNIATDAAGIEAGSLDGGSLQQQYVSNGTLLSDLNGGQGVANGQFTITDAQGVSSTVTIDDDMRTVGDVLRSINGRPADVTASINANGDGVHIQDNTGGTLALTVAEAGSSTARDLGIRGEAAEGEDFIDGSFQQSVEIEAGETLEDVVNRINEAGSFVQANIINAGGGDRPYYLNLVSQAPGADGRIVFDDDLGLNTTTLSKGQDAVAFFGSNNPANALLLTSNDNTLDQVIPGVDINLHAASDQPVQITVNKDHDEVVEKIESLVENFNETIGLFDEYDFYDQETNERGVLLGDATLQQVRQRLYNLFNARLDGVDGQFDHITQVGLRIGEGGQLEFDPDRLREALALDSDGVKNLFTAQQRVDVDHDLPDNVTLPGQSDTEVQPIGFARRLSDLTQTLASTFDGVIVRRTNSIDSDIDLNQDRIEHLNRMLADRRQRLESEFVAMERAIAEMQSQQGALNQLANLANPGSQ